MRQNERLTLGELVDKYGRDIPVEFKVYSCGRSSSCELTENDIKVVDGVLYILSDLN